MTARPPIGSVMAGLGQKVKDAVVQATTGAAIKWIGDHREELANAIIQAEHDRASAFLNEFCQRFPWAAGGISLAMNGSPEMAIAAIRAYDPVLGDRLWNERQRFVELQEHWRQSQQAKNSSSGATAAPGPAMNTPHDSLALSIPLETDRWPYVPAKFQKRVDRKRKVRLVVIHSMEAPEKGNTAENVARYFQTIPRPASAHICVDSDSIVQCVYDNNVAFAAPGVNNDGIQIELAGYAKQAAAEWQDQYSVLVINRAAKATAQYCLKYGIPVVHLSLKDLKAGKKGIIGHWDATQTYKPNSGHTDPGPNFPWDFFLSRVHHYLNVRV